MENGVDRVRVAVAITVASGLALGMGRVCSLCNGRRGSGELKALYVAE